MISFYEYDGSMNTEMKFTLLSYLCTKERPVPSSILQEVIHCSRRSVINYVNQLNEEVKGLIRSSPKGYEVTNKDQARILLLQQSDQFEYQGYEKRKQYILERLLLHQDNPTLQEFADDLYVSVITIQKDLLQLRSELKTQRLYIRTKNEQFFIVGEKKDRQAYLMNLLSQEWQTSKFSLDSIQNFFDIADISEIHRIVEMILKEAHYNLDDFSMFNYVLHLSICIETTWNQQPIHQQSEDYESQNFSVHFQRLVNLIYQKLKQAYSQCSFTPAQIMEASILMSTRIASLHEDQLSIKDMDTQLGMEVKQLLSKIISSIYSNYGISLNEEDFIIRFAYHLKNLILRVRDDIQIPSNPMFSIRDEYPFLSMIASYIITLIEEELQHSIAENETLYIALHIGTFLENKESAQKVTCDLVTLDYLNMAEQIFTQLSSFIPNLILNQICSSYETVSKDVDLVITTLPETPFIHLPQIQVHPFVTQLDIHNVAEKVSEIQKQREHEQIKKQFQRLFKEELFFLHQDFDSSQHLIRFLCGKLKDNDYVDQEFIHEIYNHERVMPTEYNNIAIPHPLLSNGNHIKASAITIWVSKQPVTWVNNPVNFVFMLALLPEDLPLFSEIFSIITSVLVKKEAAEKLLNSQNLNEFIDLLLQYYKK